MTSARVRGQAMAVQDDGHRAKCSNQTMNPILSLIICSRNDQYMGNSRWRLETSLNYVAQKVHALGREEDVEVIVADWGSEIPLCNVLQLNAPAAKIVSFLCIPPEIARVLQQDSPFPEVLALNAAARRAKGQYIGRIDQDTLVGRHFLSTFFELHEERGVLDVPLDSALLFANRRSIPYRFAVRCPSFWAVDQFVRWFGQSLPLMDPLPAHLYLSELRRDMAFASRRCGTIVAGITSGSSSWNGRRSI